jgi:hypothetical protein
MKKLDKNELQIIASYIQKRGFTYIDVQTEVLDHVACRVEEIIEEHPETTLDTAIEKAHSEFGIFGFSSIEDSVIEGLTKKYNRLFWRTFFSFFISKYLLLILFAGYAMYQFQSLMGSKTCMYITASAAILFALICLFKIYRPEYKQYLAYRLSTMYFIGLGSLYMLMLLFTKETIPTISTSFNTQLAIFSAFIVCFVLYFISALQTAKTGIKASQHIRERHQVI